MKETNKQMSGGGEGRADGAPSGPSKRPKVDHDATPRHLRAVEFYCGVGGLHYSLLRARPGAKVVAAFDINPNGNDTYEHNFGVRPSQKNIYGLPVSAFDKLDGGVWLLSPPCQPFTRQGHRKDKDDGRSQSFLRLLEEVLPKLRDPPSHLLVENVVGFERSETRHTAVRTLHDLGYDTREFMCSPRMFGVPYSRPRYFLLAKKKTIGWADGDWADGDEYPARNEGPEVWESRLHRCQPPSRLSATKEWVPAGVKCVYPRDFDGDTKAEYECRQIKHGASPEPDPSLPTYGYPVALMGTFLGYGSTGIMGHGDDEEMRLFSTYAVPEKDVRVGLGAVDVVCATSYKCNCFTKSYGKYVKGTGSMVTDRLVNKETWDGRVAVAGGTGGDDDGALPRLRYFTEREIAKIHSFPSDFSFPAHITRAQRYALLGNSLSVACVAPLIDHLLNDPSVPGEQPPPRRTVVALTTDDTK